MEDIVSSSPNARNWFRIECQFLPAAFFTMYLSITCGWRSSRRRADEQSRMCIYILCDRTTMKPNCSISQVCDERQPKLSQVQLG
jgi:cell division protein FtsW (lipid II flippase)